MQTYILVFLVGLFTPIVQAQPIAENLTYWTQKKATAQILKLTNQERKKRNLPSLRMENGACKKMAQYHADYGARKKLRSRLAHSNWKDRLKKFGLLQRNIRVSENVIWLNEHRGVNPARAVQGWMASKPHRGEILRRANKKVGIGIAQAADGVTYWVQCFLDR